MKVLVIGADKVGCQVIKQLKKNEDLEIIVADSNEQPTAVVQGVIEKVDLIVHITALNFQEIVRASEPDIVLLARTTEDWRQCDIPMGSQYVEGMEKELTKFGIPVIPVSDRFI